MNCRLQYCFLFLQLNFLLHSTILLILTFSFLCYQIKTVTPVGDRVLVKSVEPEEKTTSGILLPTSAQKKPTQGDVVSTSASGGVSTGDRVVYSKYAGTEVELDGTAHIILKEDDVIGVLKGSEDISSLSPLQDRILIEVAEAKDTTSGGLLLTQSSKDKPTIGKVVAVGPGRAGDDDKVVAPAVSVGSSVLYQKFSGSEFEGTNGKSYIVVRDMDILAVVA
jgi:chaperonin GroES